MADRMTKEQRHRCMSHIRSRDTRPEMAVRKSLFAAGFRYRLNVRTLPGTPDIVLRKYHTVIFVNGCFWHGHEGCRHNVIPQTNRDFWKEKIERNRRRDAAVQARLESLGWKVIVIWECELDPVRRGESPSRRELTLSALPQRILQNARDSQKERESRKRLADEYRLEKKMSAARKRYRSLDMSDRYSIPPRIVAESSAGQQDDDWASELD